MERESFSTLQGFFRWCRSRRSRCARMRLISSSSASFCWSRCVVFDWRASASRNLLSAFSTESFLLWGMVPSLMRMDVATRRILLQAETPAGEFHAAAASRPFANRKQAGLRLCGAPLREGVRAALRPGPASDPSVIPAVRRHGRAGCRPARFPRRGGLARPRVPVRRARLHRVFARIPGCSGRPSA